MSMTDNELKSVLKNHLKDDLEWQPDARRVMQRAGESLDQRAGAYGIRAWSAVAALVLLSFSFFLFVGNPADDSEMTASGQGGQGMAALPDNKPIEPEAYYDLANLIEEASEAPLDISASIPLDTEDSLFVYAEFAVAQD